MSVLERFHSDMWFYSYVWLQLVHTWWSHMMMYEVPIVWYIVIWQPWSHFVSKVFCWVVRSVSSHLLTYSLVVPTPRLFTASPLPSSLPGEGVWFGESTSMSGQEIQTSLWLRQTVWCLSCAGSGEEKGAIRLPHQIKGWVSLVVGSLASSVLYMCALTKEGESVASTRFWLVVTPILYLRGARWG